MYHSFPPVHSRVEMRNADRVSMVTRRLLIGQVDGKFHEGDCYMLLATTKTGAGVAQATHFWIGSECSQVRTHFPLNRLSAGGRFGTKNEPENKFRVLQSFGKEPCQFPVCTGLLGRLNSRSSSFISVIL